MNYLNTFKKYIATVTKKDGNLLSEISKKNYIVKLKWLSKFFQDEYILTNELYEINDVVTLNNIDKLFKSNEKLRLTNKLGNNQYSASFHHYLRMINQILNSNVTYEKLYKNEIDILERESLSKSIEKRKMESVLNEKKYVSVLTRERHLDIKVYTKIRAKGKCDLCKKDAPFIDKNGHPYLESHHFVSLSNDGPDAIYNTVALCPNCHRKMHNLKDLGHEEAILKLAIEKYMNEEKDLEEKFLDYVKHFWN